MVYKMDLKELLNAQSGEILENALQSLNCAHLKSYSKSSQSDNKKRLLNLLTLTEKCVIEKRLLPMKEYAAQIAKERFDAGFDLHEVHTAFNALEEELWNQSNKKYCPRKSWRSIGIDKHRSWCRKRRACVNLCYSCKQNKNTNIKSYRTFWQKLGFC
ncbi:MAG: hypothetical protein MZV64_57310 [Ignavibacteriales bacterium]|nr:hypothetical protein [Ignavibacteriales bacterium]